MIFTTFQHPPEYKDALTGLSDYDKDMKIWYAVEQNDAKEIFALAETGADINTSCSGDYFHKGKGDTPLHYAVKLRHLEAVKALVKNGANPLIRNEAGKIALAYALDAPKDLLVFIDNATMMADSRYTIYCVFPTDSTGNEKRYERIRMQRDIQATLADDKRDMTKEITYSPELSLEKRLEAVTENSIPYIRQYLLPSYADKIKQQFTSEDAIDDLTNIIVSRITAAAEASSNQSKYGKETYSNDERTQELMRLSRQPIHPSLKESIGRVFGGFKNSTKAEKMLASPPSLGFGGRD